MGFARSLPALLLAAILMVGFALRVFQPVSRPDQWVRRSKAFNEALANGDWRATYRSYHPGFTVMVAGGAGLWLERATTATPLHRFFEWTLPDGATRHGREMAAGVAALAVAITLAHGLIALVLRAFGGWPLALVTAGFLSFSPFPLAQGRIFHPDGLLSAFILLSACLLLLALERQRRSLLAASGFTAGLAILTKTTALFLVPFAGLALLVYAAAELGAAFRARSIFRVIFERVVAPGLGWGAAGALAFVLWPAVWVDPLGVLDGMFRGILFHVETVHAMPVFFAGRSWTDRPPGFLYYPAAVLLDASFVTVTLLVAGVASAALGMRRRRVLPPRVCWLLIAFVACFALQMSLAANVTGGRYMLPAHLVLAVLAAAAWVGSARDRLPVLLSVVVLELVVALPYAPDYGAHHNLLLGGNRVAARVVAISTQNEGVLAAGEYLNRHRDPDGLRVWTSGRAWKSLRQVFAGRRRADPNADVDFHLFDHATTQRGLFAEKWGPLWEARRGESPDFAVRIDGVDFVRLYANRPRETPPELVTRGCGVWGIALAWMWTVALVALLARPRASEERADSGKRAVAG